MQAVLYLTVGLIAGVSVKTGVLGVVALLAFVVLMILAFGAIGLYLAVRTGSAEQVQGLFALALGLLFLSSMVMPRNLIKADWFKEIATYNPMSYLVEAGRSLLITGWDGKALALGVGISVAAFVVALTVSITSLRGRLLRT
jgi:ABC-2 type transport system permease protein